MSSVREIVINNPWKTLFGSAGSIIAIVGALFTVDDRYAHKVAVDAANQQLSQTIIITTTNLRRQQVEDKLWELDIKKELSPTGKLEPYEAALRERYLRQLDELR